MTELALTIWKPDWSSIQMPNVKLALDTIVVSEL